MLRRVPRIALWTLAGAMLAAVLASGLLVYTEAGLRFALARLPEQMGQTRLRVEDVRGSLAGGFTVRRIEVRHPRVTVHAEGFGARVAVLPLLWQTIDVRDARMQSAFVQVYTRRKASRWSQRFLPPFMAITTEGLRIARATLIATNGKRFDGTEVVGSGSVRSRSIQLYEARMRMEDLRGEGQLVISAAEPIRLAGATHWTFSPKGQPVWTAHFDADGDLARLPFAARITAPFRAGISGSFDGLNTADWRWSGKSRIEEFDLRAWGGGGLLGKVTGQLDIGGDRKGFQARGPLQSAGLDVGDIDLQFDGSYGNRIIATRRLELTHRASRARVLARGDIGIVSGGPRLALRGDWRDFRWPLAGAEPSVRSPQGRFQLAGVWPYQLDLSGPLQVADLQPFDMTLSGKLSTSSLRVDSAVLAVLGGRADVNGEAAWSPAERWQFAGSMRELDTAQLRAALPGRVRFDFSAAGTGYGGNEDLGAEFKNVSGRVRGAAARGGGGVQRRDGFWSFQKVRLAVGGLQLELDGALAPGARNLAFNLQASDLAILAPGSRGRLRASGKLRGTEREPLIALNLSGREILHQSLQLANIDATVEIDARPKQRSAIDLRARGVVLSGRQVQRVDFDLGGNAENSTARFEAQVGATVLRSIADGRFAEGAWQGRWRSLQIDDKDDLHLRLANSADIVVRLDSGAFDQFCLRGAAAQLCPQFDWSTSGWNGTLVARNLPLDALTSGLTAKVIYDGTIGGELVLRSRGGTVAGNLRAQLREAHLRRQRSRGREDVLTLGSGDLSLEADTDRLRGIVRLDALDLGFIDASLEARRRANGGPELEPGDWPLQAELRAESRSLSFLSMLFQDIDRVAGRLSMQLRFAGTLGAPRADGNLALTDGELDLYPINLAVRQLTASATIEANKLLFRANSRVGDGTLAASGDLYWQQGRIHGQLGLLGRDLLAVNVPEARILASPDLQFRLDGRRVEVTGEVKLPSARIAPTDLAGAVLTSSDEVLADQPAAAATPRPQVAANVRMTLGDQVNIDTFGLSGRLTGSIQTRSADDGSTHATGELNVAEGKYAAFGRRLDIERGRLMFSGGLVSDPAVDIRATKQYPEVVAGVNVRGTLAAPRMTFFSTPSLPQSQIVSLILAGGNIDRSQDPNRAGAARDELLAQGSAILAQQIGSRVGVDDVSIEQNLDNTTALVLGKYLSPRLYVSYGVSLAESINTLKMRYALDDRWTIRTEAGKERSAELVYTIEK